MPDGIKDDLEKIRRRKTEKPQPDKNDAKRESTVSMPEQPAHGPITGPTR